MPNTLNRRLVRREFFVSASLESDSWLCAGKYKLIETPDERCFHVPLIAEVKENSRYTDTILSILSIVAVVLIVSMHGFPR